MHALHAHTRWLVLLVFAAALNNVSAQCVTCGNGVVDAGETHQTCPQDVPKSNTCTSPCSQPTPFETTVGIRNAYDFTGTTTYLQTGLPTGWTFESAPTSTTTGLLSTAGTDTYGAKAGLVQPNCSGGCTSTNGFCIGNIANSVAVGSGGTSGKLGANFDGRNNISQNLSYAVLRGSGNPTLNSPVCNFSAVEGFKIQFWLCASESSCGQTNGWGSCTGNNVFLDFSSNGGTSWTQIMTMNNSSTNADMCTSNSTNTFWLQEGTWSRVCLTVFKSTASPGNFYPAAGSGTAASGIMVSSTWFTSNFKFRIRYAQSASCAITATATNPGRYVAIDYPVITSGSEMIPCGISFINMCGYGADNNDDGVGSTGTTMTTVFSTVRRSQNHAERGVEILTSQNSSFGSQNLSGGTFASDYDLCNAEGGDRQCMDWQSANGFYTAVYEVLMDFERSSINLQYYKGTTAQSATLSKVTSSGETPTVGWRYSGSRFVSCSSTSDLNPGCNGYSFNTGSLPTQFIRAFYGLATNSLGNAWTYYGPTSCSNYFNGPFFAPIATPAFVAGETDYLTCNPNPVFTGQVLYCSSSSGFSGSGTLTITGPNGFSETIASNGVGTSAVTDPGVYTITPSVPTTPVQCIDCARPVCITLTAADLISCAVLPTGFISFTGTVHDNGTLLNWVTASETNCDNFMVEKSADGLTFIAIGEKDGAGTTALPTEYTFTDYSETSSTVYYRLKQTDFDGSYSYTNIIAVSPANDVNVVMPNPSNGIFTVNTGYSRKIKILNTLGKVVFEGVAVNGKVVVDITHEPAGIYFVTGLERKTPMKIVLNK